VITYKVKTTKTPDRKIEVKKILEIRIHGIGNMVLDFRYSIDGIELMVWYFGVLRYVVPDRPYNCQRGSIWGSRDNKKKIPREEER
jgi:hypothetical protein